MQWLQILMKPQPWNEDRQESWWQARRPATRAERTRDGQWRMPKPGPGKVTEVTARVAELELPYCPGTGRKWTRQVLPRCPYCNAEWHVMFVQRPVWHRRFRNAGKWTTRVPPHADRRDREDRHGHLRGL